MPKTLTLTIAGMAGNFRLGFRDLANETQSFTAKCGGKITVERLSSGTQYSVTSTVDDFRVEVKMVVLNDSQDPAYWDDCTAYGWWQLKGYDRVEFTPGESMKVLLGSAAVTKRAAAGKTVKSKPPAKA